MLRMGPYKPSIKKGHLSNSVKSTGSPITKENSTVSQHPSVCLGLGIHPLGHTHLFKGQSHVNVLPLEPSLTSWLQIIWMENTCSF